MAPATPERSTERKDSKMKANNVKSKEETETPESADAHDSLHLKSSAPASIYFFNFFLHSSIGSLLPFLPIFFNLVGFSSLQNGILCAVRPLISFCFGPLLTAVATSTRFRKVILFFMLAVGVGATFCLCLIHMDKGGLVADNGCSPAKNSMSPVPADAAIKPSENPAFLLKNHTFSYVTKAFSVAKVTDLKLTRIQPPKTTVSSKINEAIIQIRDLLKVETRKFIKINSTDDTSKHPGSGNSSFMNHMKNLKKYLAKTGKVLYHHLSKGMLQKDYFVSVLLLTIVSEFFVSPLLLIVQGGIQNDKNQSLSSKLCMTRISSKLAFAVSAFASCYIAWKYNCSYVKVHSFYMHFYAFLAMGTVASFMTFILPSGIPQKFKLFGRTCKGIKFVFSHIQIGMFILSLWIVGIAHGAVNVYLPWYAFVNGGNELAIGFIVMVSVATEIMFFCIAGYSTKWISYSSLLCIGLLCTGCQLGLLTVLNNPWYLIPTQTLNGISGAAVKASVIGYTQSVTKLGMEKVVCFLFQSAYAGLGMGTGGMAVSLIYFVYGSEKTFGSVAILTFCYAFIYGTIILLCCRKSNHGLNTSLYQKVDTNENEDDDWLVKALAEEDHIEMITAKKKYRKSPKSS